MQLNSIQFNSSRAEPARQKGNFVHNGNNEQNHLMLLAHDLWAQVAIQ